MTRDLLLLDGGNHGIVSCGLEITSRSAHASNVSWVRLQLRRLQFTAERGGSLGYALWSVIELFYEAGTLIATGATSGLPEPFVWDRRTRQWRAPASAYREMVLSLRARGVPHEDRASAFAKVPLESRVPWSPALIRRRHYAPGAGMSSGVLSSCRPVLGRRPWP